MDKLGGTKSREPAAGNDGKDEREMLIVRMKLKQSSQENKIRCIRR